MKIIKTLFFVLSVLFSTNNLYADIPHFIDFKYILNESEAGKKAQTSLKNKLNKGIKNLQDSDFRFIGITNFPSIKDNITGFLGDKLRLGDRWRPINFTLEPFNLSNPLINLNDSCNLTETDKKKSLSIWKKENFILLNK